MQPLTSTTAAITTAATTPAATTPAATTPAATAVESTPLGQSGFHLFPFAICRVAAQPFGAIRELRSPATVGALARLTHRRKDEATAKGKLLDFLSTAIGDLARAESSTQRRALLAASRNLRRKNKLSQPQEQAIHDASRRELDTGLAAWIGARDRLADALAEAALTYEHELEAAGRRLLELSRDSRFRGALALGSASVLRGLQRLEDSLEEGSPTSEGGGYANGFFSPATEDVPPLAQTPSPNLITSHPLAGQRQLLRSLLEYHSRATTKTSPFGGFTTLAAGRWVFEAPIELSSGTHRGFGGRSWMGLPASPPLATASLNKVLYAALLGRLRRLPELLSCFSINLNPSLRAGPGGFSLLVARSGLESSLELPASDALRRVVELLPADACRPFDTVVEELAAAYGAAPEHLVPRVQRLLESGFLQLNSGIADNEVDWAPILRSSLAGSSHPAARRVRDLLDDLLAELEAFPSRPAGDRLESLERCRRSLGFLFHEEAPPAESTGSEDPADAVLEDAGPDDAGPDDPVLEDARPDDAGLDDAGPDDPVLDEQQAALERNLIYEDCFVEAPATLDGQRFRPALEILAQWVDFMHRNALHWPQQANLRGYFDRAHPGLESLPFLDFYGGFFSKVYEPILLHERGDDGGSSGDGSFRQIHDPFELGALEKSMDTTAALRGLVLNRWLQAPSAEEIHLSVDDLRALSQAAPEGRQRPLAELASVNLFLQALPRSSEFPRDGLLVDRQAIHAGAGRYFSRFLHFLEPAVGEHLRQRLQGIPGALVAELCDDGDFSFNANLHPPLTDWQINYPGAVSGLYPATNSRLADLEVRPHPQCESTLQLVHRPTGQVVLPVDLGFANPLRRPPLFRVLALFTPFPFHRVVFPSTPISTPGTSSGAGLEADPETGPETKTSPETKTGPEPNKADDAVIYRPRIVLDRQVVLARRCWRMSTSYLRNKLEGKTPVGAFDTLRQWRMAQGLPQEVFYRLGETVSDVRSKQAAPTGDATPQSPSSKSTGRARQRNSHKPQYLHFSSASLCNLLLDLLRVHEGVLVFEEMLPSSEMLAQHQGKGHVAEWVVQLDRDPS